MHTSQIKDAVPLPGAEVTGSHELVCLGAGI